jgi:23S rRNA pseudouridine2605 synthase
MEDRLQKILSHAGFGSRRACEDLITAGRVTVNGQVAHLGSKADVRLDQIKLDGKLIKPPENLKYIALNKPRGVLSAVSSPDPRQTVVDLVPVKEHLFPVGRLDVDSEGLILLTNDGDLANQLTHPRYEHEKEYRVLLARHPDDRQLNAWRHGVVLRDGHRTSPVMMNVEAQSGKGAWVRVIMKEGHKRQIRETCLQIGLPVVSIIRVRISNVRIGNLKPREWRFLTNSELEGLKEISKSHNKSQKKQLKKQR